ncbi:MAG: hypothetical protein QM765_06930 [Myxococcales bacterium]
MAKARCILCGSELVGKTCPKCSVGAAGDPVRIDRDTDKRAAARRRAPAPQPAAEEPQDFEGETDKVAPLSAPPARSSRSSSVPRPAPRTEPEPELEAEPAGAQAEGDAEAERPAPAPRTKTEEKKNWYALAGMERPPDMPSAHGQDDGLPPVSAQQDELRGYHPAAIVFAATGLSSFAIAATGAMPEVASGVANLVAAGFLFKHYGWARFLAIAIALLHIAKMVLGLVLFGSAGFVVAMLPMACVLGAFLFEEAKWRGAAAGVGVALAFSWVGFYALRPPPAPKAGGLNEYALEGGKFSDDKFGLALAAPSGVLLIDAQKAKEVAKDESAGLVATILQKAAKKRATNEKLVVRATEVELEGSVRLVTLPPKVQTTSVMAQIFGEESKPLRDDELVPRKIRETEGLKSEGWRDSSLRAVLLRANDGRLLIVTCDSKASAADHLCQGLFSGIALKPSLK